MFRLKFGSSRKDAFPIRAFFAAAFRILMFPGPEEFEFSRKPGVKLGKNNPTK